MSDPAVAVLIAIGSAAAGIAATIAVSWLDNFCECASWLGIFEEADGKESAT